MQRKQLTVGMKVAVYVEAGGLRKQTGESYVGGVRTTVTDEFPQATWNPPTTHRRRNDQYVRTGTIVALDAQRLHYNRDGYSRLANVRNDGVVVELDEPVKRYGPTRADEYEVPVVMVTTRHVIDTAENHRNRMSAVENHRTAYLAELAAMEADAKPKIKVAREALAKLGIDTDLRYVTRQTPGPGIRTVVVGATVTLTLDQILDLTLDRDTVAGSGVEQR